MDNLDTNKNTKVIYKKIQKDFEKKGYINLNHRLVNTKEDLVQLAQIFRDPRYETFRIIYMKDKFIAGYESITTRTPDSVKICKTEKNGKTNAEKCYFKIQNRMDRLNANGYYLVHNHPSGSAIASYNDMKVTRKINQMVKGFKGHLIVNTNSYAWIDIDNEKKAKAENNIPINQSKNNQMNKTLKKKDIFDIKINSRSDLISLMSHIKNSTDYSIAVMTDSMGKIRMILDIPNRMINQSTGELNGYFKNLAQMNGVNRVLFATTSEEVYKKTYGHLLKGTFKDSIYYTNQKDNIIIHQSKPFYNERNLFDDKVSIDDLLNKLSDNEKDYEFKKEDGYYLSDEYDEEFDEYLPQELQSVDEGYIRILHKRVGYPPEVKVIENTLEAKQELVGGLIEVVPFYEEPNVLVICNEEGKLKKKAPNIMLGTYDFIAGDMFLIGDDYDNADFKSITRDEIIKCRDSLMKTSFKYLNYEEKVLENNLKNEEEK